MFEEYPKMLFKNGEAEGATLVNSQTEADALGWEYVGYGETPVKPDPKAVKAAAAAAAAAAEKPE
jgi:hypothetical protein